MKAKLRSYLTVFSIVLLAGCDEPVSPTQRPTEPRTPSPESPSSNIAEWRIIQRQERNTYTLRRVVWNGSVFMAVGGDHTLDQIPGAQISRIQGIILVSRDGEKWSKATNFEGRRIPIDVAWNGEYFVAVGHIWPEGYDNQDRPPFVAYSRDGIHWTEVLDLPASTRFNAIVWNGSAFVAVGGDHDHDGVISHSYDGVDWTVVAKDIPHNLFDVSSNGTRVIAVGRQGIILHSSDGIEWTTAIDSKKTGWLTSVIWDGNRFVSVGVSGAIFSVDGDRWTTPKQSPSGLGFGDITWNGEMYVATGGGTGIAYSSDAEEWTLVTGLPSHFPVTSVASNKERFVVVGNYGIIAVSP